MKIDATHLEILAAIVDAGSLGEGAERLGKSQPSVSRTMSIFEERVGEPLFVRGERPLRPTELGAALAREGKRLSLASQTADRIIQDFQKGATGSIRVGGTPIFMDGVVSVAIAKFQNMFPRVRVEQVNGYPAELMKDVETGAIDAAIMPIRPREVGKAFGFLELLPGKNVIACRDRHPILRGDEVSLEDLQKYPWVAPPSESPLFKDFQDTLASIDANNIHIGFSGGSLSAIVNVLKGSDSLTILPFSVVDQLKGSGSLEALDIRIGDPDRHL
ncbi:MAG: LysR family transcriptional regulator, partial [Pseudomonadota bacterium]